MIDEFIPDVLKPQITKKQQRISQIGKSQFLGDDDVLFYRNYSYTAIVKSSSAILFKIKKEDFLDLINDYPSLK